jgi:hypothetical protein
MSMNKKAKVTLWVLLLGLLVLATYIRVAMGMSMPDGQAGPQADALAQRMLDRLGAEAWEETRYVQWTFAGRNSYKWDRSKSKVIVSWEDVKVLLDTRDRSGLVYINGILKGESEAERFLDKAWSNYCNDSFWLIAPLKVMDEGSKRETVETEHGEALLVTYGQGGVTPGDSYLWYLNDDGLPYAYRMWVDIIPVPGLKATWEDWTALHTGVLIAQSHLLGPLNIKVTDLKSGSTIEEMGWSTDPFEI